MERNHQYEVQYLLTITIAIITFLASSQLRNLFDVWLGIALVILLAIHIILLNIIYVSDRVQEWEMEVVNRYRFYSDWTLIGITGAIPFLLLHSISLAISKSWWGCSNQSLGHFLFPFQFHFCSGGIILIAYVVPFLLTLGLMDRIKRSIFPSLTTFRNINFAIAPGDITIYAESTDTEPLFVKIENKGSQEMVFQLEIDVPDKVQWRANGNWDSGIYSQEYKIEPDRSVRIDMELEYQGTVRRTDQISVVLNHEYGKRKEQIQVLLEP